MARSCSSTSENNAVINSVVIMGSSVPGRVLRCRPAWRKCMISTIRLVSTIVFVGLSETNTIGFRGNFLKDMHQHDAFEETVLHVPPLSPLLYEVDQQEVFHLFHPALPPTSLWGHSGLLPGPTFRVYQVTQATHRKLQAQPYSYASTQQ